MQQWGKAAFLLLVSLCWIPRGGECITLFASLNGNGLRGTVTWIQEGRGSNVTALVSLETLVSLEPSDYSWAVHEFPVNYGLNPVSRCDRALLGTPIVKFDEIFGKLSLPTETISFSTNRFNLTGADGIWSHSLVLTSRGQSTCATIDAEAETRIGVAHFTNPMAGAVYFTTMNDREGMTTSIFSDVFHVNQDRPAASDHVWKIFITDYATNAKDDSDCNSLQLVWDPDMKSVDNSCSKTNSAGCPAGELTEKHGKIRIGTRQSSFSRKIYMDTSMPMIHFTTKRKLFVVIFHPDKPDTIVGCAQIRKIEPKKGVAFVNGNGAKVNFTFVQPSPFHPTRTYIVGRHLGKRAGKFHVHAFPKIAKLHTEDPVCSATGGHWNPYQINMAEYPEDGESTDDFFELGDLSGKYGRFSDLDNVTGEYLDTNLPLFGANSIMGRSVVIHRDVDNGRWICGNIVSTKEQITAVATFKYPLVGSIYFVQEADNPFGETSVFIHGLHYSDGSKNNTLDHQWFVTTGEITKDYYDWRNRCLSAGSNYNPYRVSTESRGYSDCGPTSPFRCELGDLSARHQRISVAGTKSQIVFTKRFYTDVNLPLSGKYSVIGKSLTMKDENGPTHRGDRLACTKIQRIYRVKAVAKDWFGNGEWVGVSGKLEFIQETPFSPVKTAIMFRGLSGVAQQYHVHRTNIPIDRIHPCSDHSVGGHFNPFNVTKAPARGSPDEYEVGDLSGKFGHLRDLHEYETAVNDTNMELIAPHSILGRSVVIHKKEKNARWACADVTRGYSPSEAAEFRAIASFHHPEGYAWGYIRFAQLVYNDGSLSDTTIEVNLKYPGQVNRNASQDHNWSVFVNRVGHDAAVRSTQSRCVAAGHRWNPYFVSLADPVNLEFYSQECSPQTPLRCDVGDISGRLGPIALGGNKYVFADPNLPLSGPGAILGRSLVIHVPNGGTERMACANIEPDNDIIKYANIQKASSFSVTDFMDDVRKVLGVPEWMLTYDNRKTKSIQDGECLQLLFHFRGPIASKIEQDFDRLLNGREITRPSLESLGVVNPIPRKTKLPYRSCSSKRILTKQQNGASRNSIEDSSAAPSVYVRGAFFLQLVVVPTVIFYWLLF